MENRHCRSAEELILNQHQAVALAKDDYLCPVPDTPFWNEAMAMMIADPVTGLSGSLYLSRWWGRPTVLRLMLSLLLPGDRALFMRSYGLSPDGRQPQVAGFAIKPSEDGSLYYSYDGPMELRRQSDVARNGLGASGPSVRVKIDLIFTSRLPVWDLHDTHGSGKTDTSLFPSGHVEQLGRLDGVIEINGEIIHLCGASAGRDHSRGVRDWSTHHSHMWLNAEFDSGWGFCAFKSRLGGADQDALNAAALFRDGKIIPATFESDGGLTPGADIWRPFSILLKPEGEAPIPIEVRNIWNLWLFGVHAPSDLYWGAPTGAPDRANFWTTEQSGMFYAAGESGPGRVERCNRDIVVDDHWREQCAPEKNGAPNLISGR